MIKILKKNNCPTYQISIKDGKLIALMENKEKVVKTKRIQKQHQYPIGGVWIENDLLHVVVSDHEILTSTIEWV